MSLDSSEIDADVDLGELTDDEFLVHIRSTEGRMTLGVVEEIERRGPEVLDVDPEFRREWRRCSDDHQGRA